MSNDTTIGRKHELSECIRLLIGGNPSLKQVEKVYDLARLLANHNCWDLEELERRLELSRGK